MDTPNIVIKNPDTRRIVRSIIDVIGLVIAVAMAVDGVNESFDILTLTASALAGYTVLRTAFSQTVDNPNTPRKNGRYR